VRQAAPGIEHPVTCLNAEHPLLDEANALDRGVRGGPVEYSTIAA